MRESAKGGALTEVTFLVLLSLCKPRHGYAVMQFIQQQTGGRLNPGAGTLYGAISHLCEKRWVAPIVGPSGRRKEYTITPEGLAAARGELQRLKSVVQTAENCLEEAIL